MVSLAASRSTGAAATPAIDAWEATYNDEGDLDEVDDLLVAAFFAAYWGDPEPLVESPRYNRGISPAPGGPSENARQSSVVSMSILTPIPALATSLGLWGGPPIMVSIARPPERKKRTMRTVEMAMAMMFR